MSKPGAADDRIRDALRVRRAVRATDERVVAVVALHRVVAGSTEQCVVARVALELVVAGAAIEHVRIAVADERIVEG